MPLEALRAKLGQDHGGIHFLPDSPASKPVQAAAKAAGRRYFHIDGKNIQRKEQLLNAVATALHFPASFGHNWDALEECLVDVEVDEGFVIYYEHVDPLAQEHPDQFQTFLEICRDAVSSWKEDGTPMFVLFSGSKAPKGVSRLSAKVEDED